MNEEKLNLNSFFDLIKFYKEKNFQFIPSIYSKSNDNLSLFKKGGQIKIKKENVGSFTRYCGGNVTSECIRKGKNSPDPKIRKKATFAANARKWKHKFGGVFQKCNLDKLNGLLKNLNNNE